MQHWEDLRAGQLGPYPALDRPGPVDVVAGETDHCARARAERLRSRSARGREDFGRRASYTPPIGGTANP